MLLSYGQQNEPLFLQIRGGVDQNTPFLEKSEFPNSSKNNPLFAKF